MVNPPCEYSLRKGVRILAITDIILFLLTVLLTLTLERTIFNSDPVDLKPLFYHQSFENTTNIEENYKVQTPRNQIYQTYLAWRGIASPLFYVCFVVTLMIIMGYFVLETWLFCVLLRASKEASVNACTKWFWWRLILLIISLLMTASNLYRLQLTSSDLTYLPLEVLRIFSLIVVTQYKKQLLSATLDMKVPI